MADMKEHIVRKISHPYLKRYIQTPNMDEDKLLLIISMLDQHGLSEKEMEDFVVTTMLIQIALDTHELVSNDEEDTILKTRQLTVLAGIFYSSLYYKILAESNNIAMIRLLSEGIKEINEHKIFFYQVDSDAIESLMNSIMTIESALIKKLANYLHENVWNEVSTHYLFIKRLLLEKKKFIKEGSSQLFEALRKIVFPINERENELSTEQKKYLIVICDRYIQLSKQVLDQNIQKLPSLNVTIQNRFSNLLQQNPISKTYVEEG
jgi:heptaprenyl diphosphate synthase